MDFTGPTTDSRIADSVLTRERLVVRPRTLIRPLLDEQRQKSGRRLGPLWGQKQIFADLDLFAPPPRPDIHHYAEQFCFGPERISGAVETGPYASRIFAA